MDHPKIVILEPGNLARLIRKLAYWKALANNTHITYEEHDNKKQEIIGWLVSLTGATGYHVSIESPNRIVKLSSDTYFKELACEMESKMASCESNPLIQYVLNLESQIIKYQGQYQAVVDKAMNINKKNVDAASALKKTTAGVKFITDVALTVSGGFLIGMSKTILTSYLNEKDVVVAVAKKGTKKMVKEGMKIGVLKIDNDVKVLQHIFDRQRARLLQASKLKKLGVKNFKMHPAKIIKTVDGKVNSKYVKRAAKKILKTSNKLDKLKKLKTQNIGRFFTGLSILTASVELYNTLNED